MPQQLIEITGFPELIRQIQGLANDRQRLAEMRKILRKAASGTVKEAKRQVPVAKKPHIGRRGKRYMPGNLKRSLGVITGRSRENAVMYVGPRAKGAQDGWYGHMVEYGHNIYRAGFRRDRRGGERARRGNLRGSRSSVPGNPYMQRTYAITQGRVTEETSANVAAYVQRRINALSNGR